ncbi:MAG: hypothetical protein M3082_18180 [Candidatus Dormibacteraeota bacterium]|nr:hypothetical protein [Candidatus Dormibacteraeota bacterium]
MLLFRFTRNYWIYSLGFGLAWCVLLAIVSIRRPDALDPLLLVFGGVAIGWASGTIARYVYPPPARWLRDRGPTRAA